MEWPNTELATLQCCESSTSPCILCDAVCRQSLFSYMTEKEFNGICRQTSVSSAAFGHLRLCVRWGTTKTELP